MFNLYLQYVISSTYWNRRILCILDFWCTVDAHVFYSVDTSLQTEHCLHFVWSADMWVGWLPVSVAIVIDS